MRRYDCTPNIHVDPLEHVLQCFTGLQRVVRVFSSVGAIGRLRRMRLRLARKLLSMNPSSQSPLQLIPSLLSASPTHHIICQNLSPVVIIIFSLLSQILTSYNAPSAPPKPNYCDWTPLGSHRNTRRTTGDPSLIVPLRSIPSGTPSYNLAILSVSIHPPLVLSVAYPKPQI